MASKTYFNDPKGLYKDLMDFLWEARRNLNNPPSEITAKKGLRILQLYAGRIEAGSREQLKKEAQK